MFARASGIAAAVVADIVFGDPRRGHPVALFGSAAAGVERRTYADTRGAGVVHTASLLAAVGVAGVLAERAGRRRGAVAEAASVAAATFVAAGGTTLCRTGEQMAALLRGGDLDGARALLPSLCGRDPSALDAPGLARAALESIAENTSDAQIGPLVWAAAGGTPAVLVYRAANTLDAMIGSRSPRYARFGWAAARFDDLLNLVPARLTGLLVVACAPVVGGSPAAAWRAWRRDAGDHPSPNAGVAEASFAGALGVRLGGPTQYAHELEIRPTLGDGRAPDVDDLVRAVRLSRAVQGLAAALAVSAACRSGRRASARWSGPFRPRRSRLRRRPELSPGVAP
ncbi:cobalamin biosynthesis protein [Mycolicibacterium gilvum]|uniref:Cobalamin biosynthesis protein CobD n=2 Tax=Mycolicibacterium gilvum TaxID=1804 RepID=E6TFG2_MYCSR|nr:cobalamin biosynthesis protein [Mycolicibacterium gilvum]ADT98878.1 adenosylcobinamide-phosphate synthase [Mycolicibacterium gilvum Spyr1]MCV7054540.1 cobalamin biosynthesis protein [Mycolicibacterium gilvum]STZ44321.1 cobalamin biosynthesis protein [Mycolicibacterium gilvum]